jgi:hypothetical protein
VQTIGGGVPEQGVVVEGVKGVIYACMPHKLYENSKKTGNFLNFFTYKSPKMLFFAQKYLTRYTPKTFFKEYFNFEIFRYLRHCGVIPVQSFGSHIGCQLP